MRLIYRMAPNEIDNSGAMGLKRIATWLNDNNIRTSTGGRRGLAAVHRVLTRTTYIGEHRFNTRDRKTRGPMAMPPRAVGTTTLLTGICFCACCGSAMNGSIAAASTSPSWSAAQPRRKRNSLSQPDISTPASPFSGP